MTTTTNVFSSEATKLTLNTTVESAVLKLSDSAVDLLVFVAEMQEDADHDERGVYVEFDKGDAKPFSTKDVNTLSKSGLVSVHPDSEDGVSFFLLNQDVVDVLVKYGHFMEM